MYEICNRIKYGRSNLVLLELIKTNTIAEKNVDIISTYPGYLRMELFP